MRKLIVVLGLAIAGFVGSVEAQFCPGVSPWVFDDVLASDSFCPDITWMALNNITLGCKAIDPLNRDYCPNDSVTRKQMAAFMYRLGTIRVQEVDTGPGLTGGPITLTGTIGLTATQLLPTTACASGQVPKWNGNTWTCATVAVGGGTVTSVAGGTGIVASPSPITTSGTLNLALSYQLPQGCSNGQVAKSNGSGSWTCAADNNSGGTVTSITAGAGLTGGTITTSGTLAVDPTSSTLTSYFFKQGGNAFGTPAFLGTTDTHPLELYVANARALRIEPPGDVVYATPNIIGGSPANSAAAGISGATIGGGGLSVSLCGPSSTLPCANSVLQDFDTIAGGYGNTASGGYSTVAGGHENTASGHTSTVAGGSNNTASGDYSFAAGSDTHADQPGCALFGLWASSTPFTCLGSESIFRIGANHGFSVDYYSQRVDGGGTRWVAIGDIFAGLTIKTWTGAALTDAGVWVNASSSRASKTDFLPVDVDAVLREVVRLPITTWRYKEGEGDVRHIGPMAEDFWQAFKIGYGDHTIADLDARGVEFAAIQGLYAEVRERDATIAAQQAQITRDESRIAEEEHDIAELRERVSAAESLRGELAAVKAALIEIRRSREIAAAR